MTLTNSRLLPLLERDQPAPISTLPIEYDRDANGYRLGKPRSGPRLK